MARTAALAGNPNRLILLQSILKVADPRTLVVTALESLPRWTSFEELFRKKSAIIRRILARRCWAATLPHCRASKPPWIYD